MSFTAYKLNLDGSRSHKELLNDRVELDDWLAATYGKFASVVVVNDATGKETTITDNGEAWAKVC